MTEAELQEIEQRAQAAWEGPWVVKPAWISEGYMIVVARDATATALALVERNAEFIAHARQDVPALLAEVRRLQQVNRALIEAGAALRTTLISLTDSFTIGAEVQDATMITARWGFGDGQAVSLELLVLQIRDAQKLLGQVPDQPPASPLPDGAVVFGEGGQG